MNKTLLCAALAGIVTVGVAVSAQAEEHAGQEKCFGIAAAGKNDCKSADGAHSCAGQSTRANDVNEWKFVNKGECAKLGGSLEGGKAAK
jgi:uncharacterized membrane protein